MKAQDQTGGKDSPKEEPDFYQLLHVDPDAPYEIVAEAYWFHASRLRAEKAIRRAERELAAINVAYRTLSGVEERREYDAGNTRVVTLRRQRAERKRRHEKGLPMTARLLRKRRARDKIDCYEILGVDPVADTPLIARAHSILKTLHAKNASGTAPKEYLEDLAEARGVLLDRERRAAYDEARSRPFTEPEATPKQEMELPGQRQRRAAKKPGAGKPPKAGASKPRVPEERGRSTASGWREQALPKALAAARVSGRITAAGGRIGGRGALWAAKRGGKGLVVAAEAGGRFIAQLRIPERVRSLPTQLADDRLLRYATPLPARSPRSGPGSVLHGRLVVSGPEGHEETIELGESPVTIGAGRECEVRLKAEGVAQEQAQIWFTGERFVIRSLDALHQTKICGQRVNWAGLDDGDEIEIETYRLRFEAAEPWDNPPDFLTFEREAVTNAEEIPERRD